MKALLVVLLLLLSLLPVAAVRRWRGGPPTGDRTRRPGGDWALLFLVLGGLLAIARWAPGTGYADYRAILCDTTRPVQAAAGLMLLLLPGWLILGRFLDQFGRGGMAALLLLTLTWAAAYQLLPFHLSAPDFDDFFVLAKLECGLEPWWHNDKPFFTLLDLPYRTTGLLPGPDGPFLRYAVNGWLLVLYLAGLASLLARQLPDLLGSDREARIVAAAAGLNAGLLLLSHSLHYELYGGVALLAAFSLIDSAMARRRGEGAIVLLLLAGVAMQHASHNQLNLMWLPVAVHGLIGLRQLGARPLSIGLGLLLLAVAAGQGAGVVIDKFSTIRDGNWDWRTLVMVGTVAAGAVWFAWRSVRSGRLAGWLTAPDLAGSRRLALVVYAAGTGLLFALPNQSNLLPPPLWDLSAGWRHATNHARYAALFYPFLAGLLAVAADRIARPRPELSVWRPRLLLLLLLAGWNWPYAYHFYLNPAGRDADTTGTVFQRNLRPYEAVRLALAADPATDLHYLPIPCDHGDNFLLKAATGRAARSLCRRDGAEGRLLLSRQSLGTLPEPLQTELASTGAVRPAADRGWEIQLVGIDRLPPEPIERWCRRTDLFQPPAAQAGEGR